MHIADGILSPEVCLGAGVLSAGAIGLSLRKLNETLATRTVPLTGMMAAIIFAAQMVKFPLVVAPAWGHLLGGVLAAVVVGPWAGCVAIALVLFLQMALFADGGWLAYGANVLNMGVVGSLGGYAVYAFIRRRVAGPGGIVAGAVAASWLSVVAASALFCVEFGLSHRNGDFDLSTLVAVMTSFHSLVGVGEGADYGRRRQLFARRSSRSDPRTDVTAGNDRGIGAGRWVGRRSGAGSGGLCRPLCFRGGRRAGSNGREDAV